MAQPSPLSVLSGASKIPPSPLSALCTANEVAFVRAAGPEAKSFVNATDRTGPSRREPWSALGPGDRRPAFGLRASWA